jgi:hypothetical protein
MDTNQANNSEKKEEEVLQALLQLKSSIEKNYRNRRPRSKWAPSHILSLYYDLEEQLKNWDRSNRLNNK